MIDFDEAASVFLYCPKTGVLRWKEKPSKRIAAGAVAGSIDLHGYVRIKWRGKKYQGHHIAMLLSTGAWPVSQVDHINGVRSDNREMNLREASASENQQNRAKPPPRGVITSLYPGVSWHKRDEVWRARIQVPGGEVRHLGYFKREHDAFMAYCEAKRAVHKFQPIPRGFEMDGSKLFREAFGTDAELLRLQNSILGE